MMRKLYNVVITKLEIFYIKRSKAGYPPAYPTMVRIYKEISKISYGESLKKLRKYNSIFFRI